jgi:hypothetical protein
VNSRHFPLGTTPTRAPSLNRWRYRHQFCLFPAPSFIQGGSVPGVIGENVATEFSHIDANVRIVNFRRKDRHQTTSGQVNQTWPPTTTRNH